jgi:hypothetical protein
MNISKTIAQYGIQFDRFLGSTLVLPFTGLDTIKIQPNDVATAPVINLALQKLYTNLLYLYKNSRVASNIIPISSTAVAGVSTNSTEFRWFTNNEGLSSSQFIPLTSARLWGQDQMTHFAVAQNRTSSLFSMFTTSNLDLVVYTAHNEFFTNNLNKDVSISTAYSATNTLSSIGAAPGGDSGIKWKGIQDFAFGANNSLFVLDLSAYTITKYDASGFLSDDIVLLNRLVYQDTIGGQGTYADPDLFNAPRNIDTYHDELYVLDSGNLCVKRYDQDLNWVTTYRLFRDFLSAFPVHLSHDAYGNMYVLTTQNTILRYDNNFQNKVEIPIHSLSASEEQDIKLVFSQSDPNVFYLVTDQNIYKRLVSQPDQDVGKYLFYLNNFDTTETIIDFATLSSAKADYNFMVSRDQEGATKISLWYDNLNLFDVLSLADFDIYTLDEIEIKPDEYLQNWVFNKSISKLLISQQRLADHIIGQFIAKRDTHNNITFRGTRYFLPEELLKVKFGQDLTYFVGMNEVFQNNIINRCLEKIYNAQVNMLNALQAEVFTGFLENETVFIN